MTTFFKKKILSISIVNGIFALLFLVVMLPSLSGVTGGDVEAASIGVLNPYGWLRFGSSLPPVPQGGAQQNNQRFQGVSSSGNHAFLVGSNQGNTGNEGINPGFAQDNSIDSGNQVTGQRKSIGYQQNNQLVGGDGGSNNGNTSTYFGFNQGNSGNEGVNLGNNQDNAGNSGNQVNNQGNVIGTQVNNQGSTVNNSGNIIEHQINYINLLPGVGVYVGLKPKLEFALSLGK